MAIIGTPFTPGTLLLRLGSRARRRRLGLALTRRALSERSGVPEATIKRFENTGEAGSRALTMMLAAMGLADDLERLFGEPPPNSVDDVLRPERRRGLRADAGVRRRTSR